MKLLTKFGLFFLMAICTFSLIACGDDSSGSNESQEVKHTTLTIDLTDSIGFYNSVDELPKCSDDLKIRLYKVQEDYYACYQDAWKKIFALAQGVCNIQECSSEIDGDFAFSKLNGSMYRCSGGQWLDQDGKGFSESDYVSCFMESIVLASVSEKKELPECSSEKEHRVAKVDGTLNVCSSKDWHKLDDQVISVADLPDCEKETSYVFVLGKMKAYVCKDGNWSCDGKVLSAESSSSVAPVILSSSSVEATLDSAALNDTVKVRGICMPSVSTVEKNQEVTWKFINLGGTPYTFDWIIGDIDGDWSELMGSNDPEPKFSYGTTGVKKASVVVNGDLKSTSGEIVCATLEVEPSQISGCECVANKSGLVPATENAPDSVIWTIRGCTSAEPMTYSWSIGGMGETRKVVASSSVNYTPTVNVSNTDGSSMKVSCPAVNFRGQVSAQCKLESSESYWTFSVNSVSNLSSSQYMTLRGDDGYSGRMYVYYYSNSTQKVVTFDPESSSSAKVSSSSAKVSSSSAKVSSSSAADEPEEESSSSSAADEPEEDSSSSAADEPEEDSSSSSAADEPEEDSSSSSAADEPEEDSSSSSAADEPEEESSSSSAADEPEEESSSSSAADEPEEESSSSSAADEPEEESSSSSAADEPEEEEKVPEGKPGPMFITKSEVQNQYYSYFLIYDADTLCQAATISCEPYKSQVEKGESVTWSYSSITGYTPKTYQWNFSDGSTSAVAIPKTSFADAGTVKASLVMDKGLKTEVSIQCSPLKVSRASITGCTCSTPELASASDDLAKGNVSYTWTVSGCKSSGGETLTYDWNGMSPVSSATATGTFIARGNYTPVVSVSNTEGSRVDVKCSSVFVNNSNTPVQEIEYSSGKVLEAGEYKLENCGSYSLMQGSITMIRFTSSDKDCDGFVQSSYGSANSYQMGRGCDADYRDLSVPVLIKVPKGTTLTIDTCY